ncbi:MAG: carbonic anhydrase [Spirochaetes bacterium]|nr:carbonic anhydrase [Spirochaetota bacterium]
MSINRHAPDQAVTDSKVALSYLEEGNKRFVSNQLMPKNTYKADLETVIKGQKPFAAILTCSDSRTPPEIYFDQGIGDIFVVRNAGNFADDTACGSIDFCVGVLGAPLVVVVGHNECGAVINAHKGTSGLPEELQCVLGKIKGNLQDAPDVDKAVEANVASSVERIKNLKFVKEKGALVLGAYYDIGTGVVTFYK